jgi:cellulose synthase operon protein C
MEPRHAAILQRLASGESPEAVFSSLRPADQREALRRSAVVRTFDRELYEEVLAPEDGDVGWPSFDDFVQAAEVEPVPRQEGIYRLRPEDRSAGWKTWWSDGESPLAETELPGPLRRLVSRLADYYAETGRPLDQLAQLALADHEAAAALFSRLYEAADERFDLAVCQDLVDVLSDEERGPVFGSRLAELRKDRTAYLRARSLWSAEYLRTATFLEPPGTREDYERLLAGQGPRVMHLHAPGGRGKTMELRWLIARQLVPERRPDDGRFGEGRVPCVKLDFDFLDPVNATRDPWLVLLEAAAQLNQQLPEAAFNEFLEQYGWATPLLLRRSADSSRVAAASKRLASQRARLADTVPRRFAERLAEAAGTKPVLMVFDTLEEVHLRPQGDLRALLDLLGTVLDRCRTLCMVVAGRYDLGEILGLTARELPPMLERPLEDFSPGDAERYLAELRRVGRAPVRQAIAAKAGGDPFKLSLLADIAEQSPRITPAQIRHYDADLIYLILRIISRIENPRVRWLLRYGVVPRALTLDFVRDVMQRYLREVMSGQLTLDSPRTDRLPQQLEGSTPAFQTDLLTSRRAPLDLEALFAELSRYAGSTSWVSVVPSESDTLRFHPNVVVPMRRLIRPRQVFRRIHQDAVRYYERKAAQDPAQWYRWTSEAIYHRFQLQGAEAVRYWREALDAVQLGDAEQREALAAELLGPDYMDGRGEPWPWDGVTPIVTRETLLEARFERASALTQMARIGRVSANDQLWSQAEQNLAAIELGHAKLGRPVVPAWRLAYIRAALALRDGDVAGAETLLRDALPLTDHAQDVVRLELLLADVQLARRDSAAAQTCKAALRSARKLPSGRRWEPFIRTRTVAAYTEFDQLRKAHKEALKALRPATLSADQRAELMLADAETRLRSGHLSSAAVTAREVYDQTGDWRARALSVRAAMASRQAIRALGLAGMAGAVPGEATAAAGITSSAETASGSELTGLAAGAVMEFGRAFAAFDVAQTMWYSEGDLEGAARCYVHSATLQMRDVGNLKVAEHHLLAAEELEIASGCDGWLQRSLARAELLGRQGQRAEATEQARATLEVLRDGNAPPRQLIQAAVAALAVCPPDQQAGLLDLVQAQLGLVSPPSARVVLLRDLGQVGELGGAGARERLLQIRRLLQVSGDKQLTASDRALLTLTLAEADRLTGNRAAARTKLCAAATVLRKPGQRFYLREWSLAMDRLGPRTSFTNPAYWEIKAFVREFRDYPALCAAFLVERAEPLLKVSAKKAEHLIAQAENLLGTSPEPETQWRALLYRTRAALAGRSSETSAWSRYRSMAGAAFTMLGDFIRAKVSPETAGDKALAELEASRVRVRLALGGENAELTVSTWITPGSQVTRQYREEFPVVRLLRRDTAGDPGLLQFSYEFADQFWHDWVQLGHQLGTLLFPAEAADAFGDSKQPRSDLRFEIAGRQLASVPWELARYPGTGRLVADLSAPDATVYRATSKEEAGRDEIQFVQAALNQLSGAALPVDGDFGPETGRALCRYQESQRMAADGVVRPGVLTRLQEDLAARRDDPAERPQVILVQPSGSRQLQGLRGKATLGLDLRKLYELYGFDVLMVENPTLDRLAFTLASAASGGWPPVIVHLSGGLRESRGGVAWTFASGEWAPEAFSGSRLSDEIPVSSLDRMLSVFPRDLSRPLVILDADRPSGGTENIFYLLLRNAYAAELFALGGCSAVLATGLVTEAIDPRRELYEPMVRLLAGSHSIGATCTRLRSRAISPGLDESLPLASIALFTHTPWLQPVAAGPGNDDARR